MYVFCCRKTRTLSLRSVSGSRKNHHSSYKKDVPPPLPTTSPPPPQAAPPSSPPVLPSTPPLRPAPSSPRHDPDRLGGRVYHRKTSSQDSSASSSSDYAALAAGVAAASDLRGVSSPPASPRAISPGLSPMGSPRATRDGVSSDFEKHIRLEKGSEQLGLTVETVDKGVNGCVVKAISKGAVSKDGRLQVGDYIVSINNESLRRITNAQARAILRRTSLLSNDIDQSGFRANFGGLFWLKLRGVGGARLGVSKIKQIFRDAWVVSSSWMEPEVSAAAASVPTLFDPGFLSPGRSSSEPGPMASRPHQGEGDRENRRLYSQILQTVSPSQFSQSLSYPVCLPACCLLESVHDGGYVTAVLHFLSLSVNAGYAFLMRGTLLETSFQLFTNFAISCLQFSSSRLSFGFRLWVSSSQGEVVGGAGGVAKTFQERDGISGEGPEAQTTEKELEL
ncbi:hypothetical protein BaRGS_00012853 [Batillaria attramentaria]|uniref:PDZ domain-containing protein n=1 Tax=Batillaria attramentaria TaxID=370345 RepID=A0ABD0L910_9CAEN